jgi:hypothetical protein
LKLHQWIKPENLSISQKEAHAVNKVFRNESLKILKSIEKDAHCPIEKYHSFELFDCAVDWTQRLGGVDKLQSPSEDFQTPV